MKCQKCNKAEAQPEHICPYKEDVNDDPNTKCNCCDACSQECADDI